MRRRLTDFALCSVQPILSAAYSCGLADIQRSFSSSHSGLQDARDCARGEPHSAAGELFCLSKAKQARGVTVTTAVDVRVRRVYEDPREDDGARILVDRLWPRGVSKARARLEEWMKEVAPTPELRTWYAHDPAKFAEFSARYRAELELADTPQAHALELLRAQAHAGRVTLLTATRDAAISEAVVLAELLRE
ncbi:MAG: hypothetical protein JWQ64_1836 [Subtercola sp.]|nr:hypothetical protein [Subtercola sp.]